jgi:hypothetical protein
MTRLVVIGNSHVAALKRAWDALEARPEGVELTFFAVPDNQLRAFRLDDTLTFRLPKGAKVQRPGMEETARKVNGAASISLAETDAVVLYGASVFHRDISQIMATYDVDGYRASGTGRRMSRLAFEAICDALGTRSLPNPRWLGTALPRVAVFPRPIPAEGAASNGHPDHVYWRTVAAHPDGGRAMIERLFASMAEAHARHGLDFLRQPSATLEPSGLTSALYTQGSNRLVRDERHPDDDVSHMNARYGALCLQPILDWATRGALTPA